MTEYTGSEVPLGHDKVTDFVTEVLDTPTEANEVEVEWRKPDGTVIETDKLSLGTVYRPTGSTSSNDPGHYRAKRTVATNEPVTTGYTAYIRWKVNAGDALSAWFLVETYKVVASDLTVQLGSTTLCSVADVKDRLATIPGLSLPAGATDGRLQEIVTSVHNEALAKFGATTISTLTAQQQLVGKDATILLAIGEALLSFFPQRQGTMELAKEYRRMAYEKIKTTPAAPTHDSGGFQMGVI